MALPCLGGTNDFLASHKNLWVKNSFDAQARGGLLGEEPWNRRKDIAILP